MISKIWEVYGEAQVHTYKGVSVSGECFHALFSQIRCGFLCSVGMEGRAEGNPQLCLGFCCGGAWMRCWIPKPVAALQHCGHLVVREA